VLRPRWSNQVFRAIFRCVRGLTAQLHRLQTLLRRRGSTPEDAEDLVQEAVLRLFAYTQAGGEVRDQATFLKRTVLNLAVDAHRRAHADRFEREPVETLNLVDVGPAPDEVLAAEQRLLQMRRALDRVSPRTREVFFMHRLQGFSHAEIAERLGVSKSAVEKHVATAVTVLAMDRQPP
jgi:RNA polymerase sigma factor (sigma-70 family)